MLKKMFAVLDRVNWVLLRLDLVLGSFVAALFIVLGVLFIILGQPRAGFALLGLVLVMVVVPAAVFGLAFVILRVACWIFRVPYPFTYSDMHSTTDSSSTDGPPLTP